MKREPKKQCKRTGKLTRNNAHQNTDATANVIRKLLDHIIAGHKVKMFKYQQLNHTYAGFGQIPYYDRIR